MARFIGAAQSLREASLSDRRQRDFEGVPQQCRIMRARLEWPKWMAETDAALYRLTGLRSDRLARWDYVGAFESGLTPESAAGRAAIEAD
jgi:hypothetical protein